MIYSSLVRLLAADMTVLTIIFLLLLEQVSVSLCDIKSPVFISNQNNTKFNNFLQYPFKINNKTNLEKPQNKSNYNSLSKIKHQIERRKKINQDELERRINPIILPLRILAALLRLLLLPLRILLAPLIVLLRALLQILRLLLQLIRILLLLINPFFYLFLLLEAINIAANIARIVAMILRLIFKRFHRHRKDEEESTRVITLEEEHHEPPQIVYQHKKKHHKKHKHKHHHVTNGHQFNDKNVARREQMEMTEILFSGREVVKEIESLRMLSEVVLRNNSFYSQTNPYYRSQTNFQLPYESQVLYFDIFATSLADVNSHVIHLLNQTKSRPIYLN